MDIDRALALLRQLQFKAYTAVMLVGILGYDERTVGVLLGVNQSTVNRRYRHAVTTMTDYLNIGRRT